MKVLKNNKFNNYAVLVAALTLINFCLFIAFGIFNPTVVLPIIAVANIAALGVFWMKDSIKTWLQSLKIIAFVLLSLVIGNLLATLIMVIPHEYVMNKICFPAIEKYYGVKRQGEWPPYATDKWSQHLECEINFFKGKGPTFSKNIPNSDLTTNWKLYKDNQFGYFEIKFPDNWFIDPPVPYDFVRLSTARHDQYVYGVVPEGEAGIILEVMYISRKISFDKYVAADYNPHETRKEVLRKKYTIWGKPAIDILYMDKVKNQEGRVLYVWTNKYVGEANLGGTKLEFPDNREVVIKIDLTYYQDDPRADSYNKTMDQILSTFKFY